MAASGSPCAACKLQRRKCTQECIFAPYFPPEQPLKFAYIHKVFGASNIAKLLSELTPDQREDAVQSLAWEAESRLRDPIYGCVGFISVLQHRLKDLQNELIRARKELADLMGSQSQQAMFPMMPISHQAGPSGSMAPHMAMAGPSSAMGPPRIGDIAGPSIYSSMTGVPYLVSLSSSIQHQVAQPLVIREPQSQAQQQQQQPQAQHRQQQPQAHHQQQQPHAQYQQQPVAFDLEAQVQQQIVSAATQQIELYRGLYERQRRHQQQQQLNLRFNGIASNDQLEGMVLGSGYNHPTEVEGVAVQAAVPLSVGQGGLFEPAAGYHIQQPDNNHGQDDMGGSSGAFQAQHPEGQPHDNFKMHLSLQPHIQQADNHHNSQQLHDFQTHLSMEPQDQQQATDLQKQQELEEGSGDNEHIVGMEGPSC
ncbi:hypothetical protein SAY87_002231 [Trapa incisa]|uniref:LOB domain-containing protein n=1 Tax=Trapa incisa TaxID=236973 RepID=A0AAN7PTR9_9MYRT|nr:hypothetical protein SAY87_002231 [Trapa incisa]